MSESKTQTLEAVDYAAVNWEVIDKLTKEMMASALTLTQREARHLVGMYYSVQNFRIHAGNHTSVKTGEDANPVLAWVFSNCRLIEENIKRALGRFAAEFTVGQWLQSICGIGPVISAGFIAHLDVRDRPTYGHFHSFAGLSPHIKWEKGQKRPFNAALKVLCYKVGESFVKVQNNKKDYYGKLYAVHKAGLVLRNERGDFAEDSARILTEKNWGKDTDAYGHYSGGRLPPAHIHARARRYVAKLLLSHLHTVMYEDYYKTKAPIPYPFSKHAKEAAMPDHRHLLEVPNWPMLSFGKDLACLLDS